MRLTRISLAIATALLISTPVLGQEKIPANGTAPTGPAPESVLGVDGLPGLTCSSEGGTNCPSSAGAINNTTPLTSTFDSVGCGSGTLADVNVGLNISHTWVGDLKVTLTSPDSTSVVLIDRPGNPNSTFGCSGDNIEAVMDDEGSGPAENVCFINPAIAGTLIPTEALSTLQGESGAGSWSLLVEDSVAGDTGTLYDWSVDATCSGSDEPRATFRVTKDFTDDNPGEVTVSIDCNTGLILDQDKQISEGEFVEFVVTDYTEGTLNCTITETDTAGYSAEYFSQGSSNSEGCEFTELDFGAASNCRIVNTPEPVTLTANKTWLYPGSEVATDEGYDLYFSCDAEIEGGYSYSPDEWYYDIYELEGDGSNSITVHPSWQGNTCSVSEGTFSDFVESDSSDCQGVAIELGTDSSCEIINTVFYEGIPTLSHYGLAVLALSMFGLGMVGFRRFV